MFAIASIRKTQYVTFLWLISVAISQILPGLPDLPSTQPSVSEVAPNPSESPATSTPSISVIPSPLPSEAIVGDPTPNSSPSVSPSSSKVNLLPEISPLIEDPQCTRDTNVLAPTLGTSQLRYALSVVGSAAAVAFASVVYTASASSDKYIQISTKKESGLMTTNSDHDGLRVAGIIFARVLIAIAIKVSAALVASIANSSPEDGALDASGAFITWASAILTRTYYEAIQMTLRALGFLSGDKIWDRELREYLEPTDPNAKQIVADEEEFIEESVSQPETLENACEKCEFCEKAKKRSTSGLGWYKLLFWGRKARFVLLCHALLYIVSEAATLIINLKDFVSSFSSDAARTLFVPADEAGQCGIKSDLPCT